MATPVVSRARRARYSFLHNASSTAWGFHPPSLPGSFLLTHQCLFEVWVGSWWTQGCTWARCQQPALLYFPDPQVPSVYPQPIIKLKAKQNTETMSQSPTFRATRTSWKTSLLGHQLQMLCSWWSRLQSLRMALESEGKCVANQLFGGWRSKHAPCRPRGTCNWCAVWESSSWWWWSPRWTQLYGIRSDLTRSNAKYVSIYVP